MKLVELVMLARVMSQRYGVEVNVSSSGMTASCQSKKVGRHRKFTIALPALEDKGKFDKMTRGYLDHELGHVSFTDWDLSESTLDSPRVQNYSYGLFKDAWNIFEDVYVERKQGEAYPGSAINIKWLVEKTFTPDMARSAVDKLIGEIKLPTIVDAVKSFLSLYLLYKRRAMANPKLGHSHALLDKVRESFISLDSALEALFAEIDGVLTKPVDSTKDALALAQEVAGAFLRWGSSAKGTKYSKRQKCIGDLIAATNTNEENGDDEEGGKKGSRLQFSPDVGNAFSSMIMSGKAEVMKDLKENLRAIAAVREAENLRTDSVFFLDVPPEIEREIADARSRFMRLIPPLLQSAQYKPSRTGYSGKLSGRDLYKSGVGNGKIFIRKAERKEQRVDAALLLDASGSMVTDINQAQVCLYGMLDMLKALPKVKAYAAAYYERQYQVISNRRIWLHANGGTPSAGATIKALSALSVAPDVRRLLFIITDGQPDDEDAFESALAVAAGQGVEVYGIALGKGAWGIKRFFDEDYLVYADTVKKLPEKLADIMKRALVKVAA